MMQNAHHPDGLQVALLTVHIDPETVENIRQTAARMPWELINVDYSNYVSGAKQTSFTQRAMSAQACVAVVDFDGDAESALDTAEFLRQNFHLNIGILALSASTDPDLLLRAMRAGYSEFLARPFDLEEFTDTLNRLDHRWANTMVRRGTREKFCPFSGRREVWVRPRWRSTWPCFWFATRVRRCC
jgi:FixJ family two-component response regulator